MHSVFLRYDDDYDVYHLLLSVSKKGVLLNMHVADVLFLLPQINSSSGLLSRKHSHRSPEGQRCGLYPLLSICLLWRKWRADVNNHSKPTYYFCHNWLDGSSALDITFLKKPCFWNSYFYKDCLKMTHLLHFALTLEWTKQSVVLCWKIKLLFNSETHFSNDF